MLLLRAVKKEPKIVFQLVVHRIDLNRTNLKDILLFELLQL